MKIIANYICDSCGKEFREPTPDNEGVTSLMHLHYHSCINGKLSDDMPKDDVSGIALCRECTAKLREFLKTIGI